MGGKMKIKFKKERSPGGSYVFSGQIDNLGTAKDEIESTQKSF